MKRTMIKNTGLTIVELMVAITIGMIAMIGIVNILITNSSNSRVIHILAQQQEDAMFALDKLTNDIELAAYRSKPLLSNLQPFPDLTTVFPANQSYITGTNGMSLSQNDTITIRYQGSGNGIGTPDGLIKNCENISIDAFTTNTDTFSVNSNGELMCNNMVLISNVELMKVRYGEDLTGDRNANRYISADFPGINWQRVVAARIALLIRSEAPVLETPSQNNYSIFDTIYAAPSDKYLRRIYITTIKLRNIENNRG